MNSSTGNANSQRGSSSASFSSQASLANYQFDFGLGSSRSSSSRPLKEQKPNPSPFTAPTTAPSANPAPSWAPHQPRKPAWTHQPAPPRSTAGLANPPPSMVGDIFGKSWTAAGPASSANQSSRLGIGIRDSNPNLFGDLVGSALNRSKSGTNAPLKSAPPKNPASATPKDPFNMGNLSNSLPKSAAGPTATAAANPMGSNSMGSRMGGQVTGGRQPTRSMTGAPMNAKRDPFASLPDFGSKQAGSPPMASSNSANFSSSVGDDFGAFQNVSSSSPPQQQTSQPKSADDSFDMFFAHSASSTPAPEAAPDGHAFSEMNDWDLGSEFGGAHDGGGPTTELEGLPPPPVGVTASAAVSKGLDNHKQGQYADAIKWLSWAVVLLEKAGDNAMIIEVLSCRASCYKEVGEYKKAVSDCSKVLEQDSTNVSVLLQRALLYESSEKYKLGAEDLRMVLKIDPANRLARSTIHRLSKMAD